MKMIFLQVRRIRQTIATCLFGSLCAFATLCHSQSPQALTLYHRSLAATCANCHGTNGKGVVDGGMPLINNITSEQMLAQLKAYKSGALEGTIMPQLMRGYSEEQIEIIAQQLGKKE